jgi:hypothetical protein
MNKGFLARAKIRRLKALEFVVIISSVFSMAYSAELKSLFKGDLTKLCKACLSAPVPLSACTPKARPSLIAGLSAPAQQEGQPTGLQMDSNA